MTKLEKIKCISRNAIREFNLEQGTHCMCAIVTHFLFRIFKNCEIKAKLNVIAFNNDLDGHCFLTTIFNKKKYVIDLTFQQFDKNVPLILIETYRQYSKRIGDMKVYYSGYSTKAFLKELTDWPDEQKPILLRAA